MEGDTFCGEGHILLEEVGRFQQLGNKFYEHKFILSNQKLVIREGFHAVPIPY